MTGAELFAIKLILVCTGGTHRIVLYCASCCSDSAPFLGGTEWTRGMSLLQSLKKETVAHPPVLDNAGVCL